MGKDIATIVFVTPQMFCMTATKIKWVTEYNKCPMSPMSSTLKHLTLMCIFSKNINSLF